MTPTSSLILKREEMRGRIGGEHMMSGGQVEDLNLKIEARVGKEFNFKISKLEGSLLNQNLSSVRGDDNRCKRFNTTYC